MQTYVDDPAIVIAGSKAQRNRIAALVLLLWLALGAKIQAHKAQMGKKVEWIGVQFILNKEAVAMGITARRLDMLKEQAKIFLDKKGMAKVEEWRSFTGLTAWVTGIVPRVRPFTTHL